MRKFGEWMMFLTMMAFLIALVIIAIVEGTKDNVKRREEVKNNYYQFPTDEEMRSLEFDK